MKCLGLSFKQQYATFEDKLLQSRLNSLTALKRALILNVLIKITLINW